MRRHSFVIAGLFAAASTVSCTFAKHPGQPLPPDVDPNADAAVERTPIDVPPPRETGAELIQLDSGADLSTCVEVNSETMGVPPDVLILLDRSGSMANNISDMACRGGCGASSKWSLMTAAINQVMTMTETSVKWGLKFFGNGTSNTGDSACQVDDGAVVVPAIMNAGAISTAIAATMPLTATPTTAAELSAGNYLATLTDTSPKYVLLATDGQPTCGMGANPGAAADDANAIAAVSTVATMGFQTFVVGIATTGMGMADMTLNQMAVNGGLSQAGTTKYFPVASTDDLVKALLQFAKTVGTCTFAVNPVPMDASTIDSVNATGYMGNIPQDPTDGWSLVPGMGIQLNGSACDQYTAGTITNVQVHVACIIP